MITKKSITKISVVVLLVLAVFALGCLNYKAYNTPQEETRDPLVEEIAKIEQELAAAEQASETAGDEQAAESTEETAESSEPSTENTLTGAAVTEEAVPENLEETAPVEETVPEEVQEVVLPEPSEDVAATEEQEEQDNEQVLRVKENEKVKLQATVVDPDQDQVTYTFGKPLDKKGEWKTNYGDAGEYAVTLTATDGKLTSEKKVKLVVERVNVAPTLAQLKDLVVKEGEVVRFKPEVSDPNKDKVTVTVSAPLENGTFFADYTSAGEYLVTVTVTDGELTTEGTFTLKVQDVNQLPVLSNLQETLTVKEGELVTLNPSVEDLDGDEVEVSISTPIGNSGVWQTKFTDHGEYYLTVTADDGKDTVSKRVRLVVEDVNMPPEIVDVVIVAS